MTSLPITNVSTCDLTIPQTIVALHVVMDCWTSLLYNWWCWYWWPFIYFFTVLSSDENINWQSRQSMNYCKHKIYGSLCFFSLVLRFTVVKIIKIKHYICRTLVKRSVAGCIFYADPHAFGLSFHDELSPQHSGSGLSKSEVVSRVIISPSDDLCSSSLLCLLTLFALRYTIRHTHTLAWTRTQTVKANMHQSLTPASSVRSYSTLHSWSKCIRGFQR